MEQHREDRLGEQLWQRHGEEFRTRLAALIGAPPRHELDAALRATVGYFKETVNDLAV